VVWIWHLISDFNGCFGDVRCIATINLLQARRNAASAIAATAQGGFVRTADLYALAANDCNPPFVTHYRSRAFASFTIDWTMGGTEAVVSLRSGLRSGASPGFSGFAQ
jgi:hypothetical protein